MNIFFDVDGVLIDGFHAKAERRNRWDRTLKEDLGIEPDKFQDIFSGWFVEVLHGRLDFEKELASWLELHHYDVKAFQVIDYWHRKDSVLNAPVWNVVQKRKFKSTVLVLTSQVFASTFL